MPTPFNVNPLDDTAADFVRTGILPIAMDDTASEFSRTVVPVGVLDDTAAEFARTATYAIILDDTHLVAYQPVPVTDAVKYRLLVFDINGNLTAMPQDVLQGSFEDLVNAGSGQGTFTVPRLFVDVGWVGLGYRVQFFLDDGLGDPWYDGRVQEIDQNDVSGATQDYENVEVHCEGWSTHLDDSIVSEVLSPGVQANGVDNGTMRADQYLIHLITTYMNSTDFAPAFVTNIPIDLDQITFDGTGLSQCIDTIIKQLLDNTGQTFEWWVRGQVTPTEGRPGIVIQPNSNPALVTTNYYSPARLLVTQYLTEFMHATIYEYKIQTSSRDLYNMIALYGGNDPSTGLQTYGPFKDSTSIALYGLRQQKVTNSSLISTDSLSNYATAYLLINGYPQPQGSFKKFRPSDYARGGQWFQMYEPGLVGTDGEQWIINTSNQQLGDHPPNLKQVRAVRVVTEIQNQDRIEQTVYTTAPRPYIDQAYYGAINSSANLQAGKSSLVGQAKLATYYVVGGGDYTGIT
jgi:hypothetical protein